MTLDSKQRRLFRLALTCLAVAAALAAGSVVLQRHGPELEAVGYDCGATGDQPCMRPLLNGGWPLGFVYDRPGAPGEGRLGITDEIRLGPYLGNLIFYAGLLSIAWRYGQARRRRRAGK